MKNIIKSAMAAAARARAQAGAGLATIARPVFHRLYLTMAPAMCRLSERISYDACLYKANFQSIYLEIRFII
jgi:hypothetical protein